MVKFWYKTKDKEYQMKLIEKLKSIPKKKLIIVGILTAILTATVIITVVIATHNRRLNENINDDLDDSIDVFNSINTEHDNTQSDSSGTVEPIDTAGINGLAYRSNGNGSCEISGIGTCSERNLEIPAYSPSGDMVTKIADGAFANCTNLISITIPSTVKAIGTGAFRGCSSLVSITVDTENMAYTSVGDVLFSKDKTVLICVPMNRPGNSYLLSTNVKAVAAYAFEGVKNIKQILFEGSIHDFQKIDFLIGNGIVNELPITCNYKPAK